MNELIDRTGAVRPGEELDVGRLQAYLQTELGHAGVIEIEQFPGGYSNLTYLVRQGEREYVLRRPPHGSSVKTAHDMGREYRVLSRLAPVFAKAPRPILFCGDASIIGAEFYLMQPIRGVILRRDPPPGLAVDSETAARLSKLLIDTLAELHAIDYEAAGLSDLGKPAGYVERQITGWTKRYEASQTDEIPAMQEAASWLADRMPPDGAPALIHNDYKFDNVIFDPQGMSRIIGILDWEMCTIGDPLMDLGTTLCYWVEQGDPAGLREMRFGPTTLPGMPTRQELADRYAQASGRDLTNILYYYIYGLFKTAVVAQQIYYRFAKGLTRDQRFARMIMGVRAMAEHAVGVLEQGRI